jgi:uncharacterized membrane protein YraQ (UPF0718 family)
MSIFSPVQSLANLITYRWLNLSSTSHLAGSLNFFIFDTIKIFFLLIIINYLMAIVRYYLPVNKIKKILTSHRWYGLDYLLAALLGVVTPFCSCSSIPLFIGFVSAGIPLGVTFAFLITSPLVNEASLALFPAMFGLKISIIYNLAGVVVGMLGGMIIQKLKMEKYIEPAFLKLKSQAGLETENRRSESKQRIKFWWSEGWTISKSILPYILLGVGVGALIHGFVPANFFEKYLAGNQWWSVPAATLLGVPFYANSVSVIPVIEALVSKGVSLGTALAFMTATVTLSIPEALILKKAMKLPLLLTFFGITTIGIMLIGYLFNLIG